MIAVSATTGLAASRCNQDAQDWRGPCQAQGTLLSSPEPLPCSNVTCRIWIFSDRPRCAGHSHPGPIMVGEGGQHEEKSRKYDRQIRIWGQHGQNLLEAAKVCLLNASATGAEALKNLVLAGISGFTIVDNARVCERDLGNNFLLQASQLGQPRCSAVAECLHELNDAVRGSSVEEDPVAIISDKKCDFFRHFTLVIATQLPESTQVELDGMCRELGVTVVFARTYGLLGSVRVSLPEAVALETHPDSTVPDIRVHDPWPELLRLASEVDLEALDDMHHAHVPWALLLVQCVARWKGEHGGGLPSTRKEQEDFRAMVKALERRDEAGPLNEVNVKEAATHAKLVWAPPRVRAEVIDILNDRKAQQLDASTPDFWILVAALRRFVSRGREAPSGVISADSAEFLPLDGAIPDMTSTTTSYLALQQCYRQKADEDAREMVRLTDEVRQEVGRDAGSIPAADVRHFCKHCRDMRVVRLLPLSQEYSRKGLASLKQLLMAEGASADACAYLALRACDAVLASTGRYPGTGPDPDMELDKATCVGKFNAMAAEIGVGSPPSAEDIVGEVVRFGASEPHPMAAIIGGIAAQEVLKVTTQQFVVAGGTLLYNGIMCTTTVLTAGH